MSDDRHIGDERDPLHEQIDQLTEEATREFPAMVSRISTSASEINREGRLLRHEMRKLRTRSQDKMRKIGGT